MSEVIEQKTVLRLRNQQGKITRVKILEGGKALEFITTFDVSNCKELDDSKVREQLSEERKSSFSDEDFDSILTKIIQESRILACEDTDDFFEEMSPMLTIEKLLLVDKLLQNVAGARKTSLENGDFESILIKFEEELLSKR